MEIWNIYPFERNVQKFQKGFKYVDCELLRNNDLKTNWFT